MSPDAPPDPEITEPPVRSGHIAPHQRVVAEFGTFALRNSPGDARSLQALLQRATEDVAAVLDVEYAKVLETLPGGANMLLRTGVGWRDGLVGEATVDTGRDSQAGYTLLSDHPVVVADLAHESRFHGPPLLIEHGVVAGVSCVITGPGGAPWGVLGVHTRRVREFDQEDVHFVQTIANFLGAVLQRQDVVTELRASEKRLARILEQLPTGVVVAAAPSGEILYRNAAFDRLLGHDFIPAGGVDDYAHYRGLHPDGTPYAARDYPVARALAGEAIDGEELTYRHDDGETVTLAVSAGPVQDENGNVTLAIGAFHDITDHKRTERELTRLSATLEERVEARTRQVRDLAKRLSAAERNERARIAQILHDDVQQVLYALRIQLGFAGDDDDLERVRAELDDAQAMLGQAIDLTRTLSVASNPPVLREEGLAAALRWLASSTAETYSLEVDLDLRLDEPDRLGPDERTLALHTARELLFNVVKHAGVERAALRAELREERLTLEVRDHGNGFDPHEAFARRSQSFGLANIRQRLELDEGTLEIHAAPGEGTLAVFTLPVGR